MFPKVMREVINDVEKLKGKKNEQILIEINKKYQERMSVIVAANYLGLGWLEVNLILELLNYGKLYSKNIYDVLAIYALNNEKPISSVYEWWNMRQKKVLDWQYNKKKKKDDII